MPSTPLAQIAAGMTAAEAVAAPGGAVLIRAGEAITARHLLALRALGITHVVVSELATASQRAPSAELVHRLQRELLPRFAAVDVEHEAGKALFRIALVRRVRAELRRSGHG